jgi:hypothetical protein
MKRYAFRFLVSLLTLIVGVGSSAVWHHYWPPSLEKFTRDREHYAGKEVRLRALLDLNELSEETLTGREPWFTISSQCEAEECAASVKFDQDVRLAGLDPYHYVSIRGAEPPPQNLRFADVVIVGTLNPADSFTHCFTPSYSIRNARIERVINKYEFGSVDAATNWFRQIRH